MLAPNQVSAPAASQTSSIPPNDGTARLTSDGCTKIDAPMMVPTTIAVACGRPIERVSVLTPLTSYVQGLPRRSSRELRGERRRAERLHGCDRVRFQSGLVRAVSLDAREAKR